MIFNWVLLNKIAIGTFPKNLKDISTLELKGIKSILNLTYEYESNLLTNNDSNILSVRYSLPDHKSKEELKLEDIASSIEIIDKLLMRGPIYIHCYASIERSPIVCMAWLVKKMNLKPMQAMDYLKQVHKPTNPLIENLSILKNL